MKRINYIVINDETQSPAKRQILTKKALPFSFPLSLEDRVSIASLEEAFEIEGKIAGLAAPQIGIAKQAIIFKAPEELKKWRSDFTEVWPTTLWLNPEYEAFDAALCEDYEGCFSIGEIAGRVPRFKKIKYKAFLPNGDKIEGIAEGYVARIIQHEVDHINGVLFISKIPKSSLLTMEEYCRIRDAKMAE